MQFLEVENRVSPSPNDSSQSISGSLSSSEGPSTSGGGTNSTQKLSGGYPFSAIKVTSALEFEIFRDKIKSANRESIKNIVSWESEIRPNDQVKEFGSNV